MRSLLNLDGMGRRIAACLTFEQETLRAQGVPGRSAPSAAHYLVSQRAESSAVSSSG